MLNLLLIVVGGAIAIGLIYYVVKFLISVVKGIVSGVAIAVFLPIALLFQCLVKMMEFWPVTLIFLTIGVMLYQIASVFGIALVLLIYAPLLYQLNRRKKIKAVTKNLMACVETYCALPVDWLDQEYVANTQIELKSDEDRKAAKELVDTCFQKLIQKGQIKKGTLYQLAPFYYKDEDSIQRRANEIGQQIEAAMNRALRQTGLFQYALKNELAVSGLHNFDNLYASKYLSEQAASQYIAQSGGTAFQTSRSIIILSQELLNSLKSFKTELAIEKNKIQERISLQNEEECSQVIQSIFNPSEWTNLHSTKNNWLIQSATLKKIIRRIGESPLPIKELADMVRLNQQQINPFIEALTNSYTILLVKGKNIPYLISKQQKDRYICKKCHKFFVHLQDYGPDGYCRSCQKELEEEGEQVRRYVDNLPPGIKIKT